MNNSNEKDYFNVLIVDDDLNICELLKEYLLSIPNVKRVVLANDGKTAVAKMRNQKFDLITLDMKMPRKAGHEILSDIVLLNAINSVLIISGAVDKDIVTIAVFNGVKNFLVKPFNEEAFKEKALKILSQKEKNK